MSTDSDFTDSDVEMTDSDSDWEYVSEDEVQRDVEMTDVDDPSESSDEELAPYQYEPCVESDDSADYPLEPESESDEQHVQGIQQQRKDPSDWCQCTHCQQQYQQIECVCCKELQAVARIVSSNNLECIIDHESFNAVCLNKDVLWTALVSLKDRENIEIPPNQEATPLRTWRYAAYRQFIWWVHNRLGRNVRRVIPSCASCRIRAEFEDENGNYTRFVGHDPEASEIVSAMEF